MIAVFRVLLWCYPASFRCEYGPEMQANFLRRWRLAGTRGRALLMAGAVADAIRHAPALHFEILRQDAAFTVKAQWRAPGLGVTVVLVAALGIGATTTTVSIVDHVLIRPLPFRDADRLVKIWQTTGGGGRLEPSPAHLRDWQQAQSFEAVAAYDGDTATVTGRGEPLLLDGAQVSGILLPMLGVRPLAGRTLVPADDHYGAPGAVVISERVWRTRFNSDPVIGTVVTLNDGPYTIVGIMPAHFGFPTRVTDYWRTYRFAPNEYVYENPFLNILARLRPGVSRAQGEAEVRNIVAEVVGRTPRMNRRLTASVIDLRDEVAPQSRMLLWCLLGAAGGVLLIACTNLANLLLTRGLARRNELALRAALGAGRHRLLRQLLTESLLLAGIGGAVGIVLAAAGLPLVARLVPTSLPIAETPALDMRMLSATLLVTLGSAVAFGLWPAWRTARQADAHALRTGARGGISRTTERLRSLLVVGQVGASVVLLVSSGLLLRAMLHVQAVDPGFQADGVATVHTAVRDIPRYQVVAERERFYRRVLDDVRALPGVSHAAFISGLPMVMRGMIFSVRVPDQPDPPDGQRNASQRFVTPGFFGALGIPLLEGRDIEDGDSRDSRPVAVVSESFVRRYWPQQSALGRTFRVRNVDHTIVGVAGDVHVRGLERDSEPQMYFPSKQMNDRALSGYVPRELVVRSSLRPAALAASLHPIIRRADSQVPVTEIRRVSDIVDDETAPRRVQVRVIGIFTAAAFLLAAVGLHGLLTYNVSQRAREFGVRLALGEERRSILALVLRRGLALAVTGVTVGAVLAVAAARLLQALLFGTNPTDAGTFATAIALALMVSIASCLPPALRAARADPIEAMRAE